MNTEPVRGGDAAAPVTVALIGAGNRGQGYVGWIARHRDRAKVVAVADPDPHRRSLVQAAHPEAVAYKTWAELLADPDAVFDMAIVATQDQFHREPVLALAERGTAILLPARS